MEDVKPKIPNARPAIKRPPEVHMAEPVQDWLMPVQRALINTQGVFFIKDVPSQVKFEEANENRTKSNWTFFSKLGRRICKSYMLAAQNNPYILHPAVETSDGPLQSTCLLAKSSVRFLNRYTDRSFFSIWYGDRKDFMSLELLLKGTFWRPSDHFRDDSEICLALVIPGFALQALDECFQAVTFRIKPGFSKRSTCMVFACAPSLQFRLPSGKTVDEARQDAFPEQKPCPEPLADNLLIADVQSPCGKYRAVLQVDADMTADELKTLFVQHTEWCVDSRDLGLICQSQEGLFFEGTTLAELASLMDSPKEIRFTAHPKQPKL